MQHLAEIVLAVGIAAMEIGGEILDSLARLWEHLDPSKNMNTQGFLDALNEVSVKLRDFILGLGDHFESFMANGGQDLLNAFGDLAMNIGEAIVRGFGVGIDALDGLLDHLDPANNPKTKNMLKSWENAFGSIGDMALSFVGLLESTLENGGQEIINSLGDLGVDISAAIGVFVDEIAKAFAELFDHMDPAKNKNSKDMLKSFDNLVDSIDEFVVAATKLFKKFMDSGGREFVKNLGDIVAIVLDLASAMGSGIIDIITGFMNSWAGQALIEGAAKALEWFSDKLEGLKDVIEPLKDVFRDVVDFIVGIFEGDGEKVGRAFVSFVKNALKVGLELSKFMGEIGEALILGLIEGIKALPGLLWECIKFIFDFIVGAFKELFGIHSPSTVFADLGVNLIEGLIEGITNMISSITDALTKIKDAIFGWFEDILSSASENWNKLCEATSKKWGEIKESVADNCKKIFDDTKEKWTNIKDNVSETISKLKDDASEKYSKLKETLTDTMDKWRQNSEEKWNKVKEKTTDLVSNLKSDTEDKYNKFKETLTDTMDKWRQNSEDKWTKVKDKATELVSNLKSTVEDKYTKFKDNLTDTVDKWRQNSEDKWTKVKDKTTELATNLKDTVEEKYTKFKDNLTDTMEKWRSNSEDKWNKVKDKTVELSTNLKDTVEEKYSKFKDNLTTTMEGWRSNNETKWGEIKKNTFDLVNVLRADAEGLYLTMQTNLGTILNDVKTEASTKWDNIKSTTTDLIDKTVSESSRIFGNIKGELTSKLDDAKAALDPKWETLKSNAKTKAEGMVSSAKSGFSGLSRALTDVINDAKDAASKAWQGVKDAFSKLEFSMPKIKLPKLKIEWETLGSDSSWFPSIKYPKLSWYARGGIIDGITPLGMTGSTMHMGGEAGKEMVVPLENTSFTSKIAQAMGQAVDNAMARNMNSMYGSYANNSSDSKDIILKVNERELARASINSINKLQRESGRTLLDI